VEALGRDRRPVDLRGQPLRLLGLLLVRRGTPVADDVAIDALWDEALPANPANALQLVVSRLRRAVGTDAITRDAAGYALRDAPVDADRFEALAREGELALARGDPAEAADRLRAALALWRGPALHGVRYERYAAGEVARLEERRAACLEARIDADLALGRSRAIVDELAGLVAEHPGRERLRLQHARALLDSGRRAEALAAHRGVRPPARRPERREVVCVGVDLSARGTADVEVQDGMLALAGDELAHVLARHGDPVIEPVPEGLIAVFGATRTHEDDCLRAVRAATALQRRATALGLPLDVRAAVTAGTVLVTARGGLPSGGPVAAAARAARGARPGEVALSDDVRARVAGRAGRSPFAGREAELAALGGAGPGLLLLLGEPGIGKSRLVRELASRSPARVLVGRCPASGDGVTYWPLREIVLQAAAGAPIGSLLDATPRGGAAASVVGAAIGLGGHAPTAAMPWAFRALFAALARTRATTLVIDDAHWAEPALLDLLDGLAAGPLPLVCSGRPELLTMRPAWAQAPCVRLGPLGDADSCALLGERPGADLGRIVARARGNPLFLEQLAAHVAESGDEHDLPPALHALLAARLDTLTAAQRRAIEAAAVEGELFHTGAVAALGADPAALEPLVARELLRTAAAEIEGERALRFRHALVRDAAYAALPLAERADAHERVAGWLDGLGAAVPDAAARIAGQLERAHGAASAVRLPPERVDALARAAAARLTAAGAEAHARGDVRSEIAFLDRALVLRPGDVELLPVLGAAVFEAGSLERATELAAAGIASGVERIVRRGEVERERLDAYRHPETVDPAASLAVAERAVTALEACGDQIGVARARYLMCELEWMRGRSERSQANAGEVVRLARGTGGAVELDAGMSFFAWGLVINRVPVPAARRRCRQLLREVEGRRFAELGVRGFLAVLDAMAGRFAAAREQLAASRVGVDELGLNETTVWLALFDAMAAQLAGELDRAPGALADAERVAAEVGDRWFLSTILVERANVLVGQGSPEAAEAVARIDDIPAPADTEWLIKRHTARGKLAAREGDAERALDEARRAVAIADASEMFLFRADAWRDLAWVCERIGAPAWAARATALRLYEAKGNTAAARQLAERAPSR
jgi:DNA-binding SARP family transcriptional activator